MQENVLFFENYSFKIEAVAKDLDFGSFIGLSSGKTNICVAVVESSR